jgi:hypothetical protein
MGRNPPILIVCLLLVGCASPVDDREGWVSECTQNQAAFGLYLIKRDRGTATEQDILKAHRAAKYLIKNCGYEQEVHVYHAKRSGREVREPVVDIWGVPKIKH